MKYLIKESQFNRLRFIRRQGEFPRQYIKNLDTYQNPCKFKKFNQFIQRIIDDSIFDWMELKDMDYITDFIQGDMWEELEDYYHQKCKNGYDRQFS